VTIAVVFVADVLYLYPKMLRYQHHNRDIAGKVNTWQFADNAQKQALITIMFFE